MCIRDRGSPWSVNLKNASIRDDVQLESTTPDDTSQLRLNKPALEWDGPAIEDAASDVVMLEAPEIHYQCLPCDDSPAVHIPNTRSFARVPAPLVPDYVEAGWTAPRCICHYICEGDTGSELFDKEVEPQKGAEKLGRVDPLSSQVKSAPNLMEPTELAIAKASIVFKPGTFARKVWDRKHGTALAKDL